MTETVEQIAARLSGPERDLLTGNVSGWGSWIWGCSGGLIAKGLFEEKAPGNRQPSALGLAVRRHLQEQGS